MNSNFKPLIIRGVLVTMILSGEILAFANDNSTVQSDGIIYFTKSKGKTTISQNKYLIISSLDR